MSKSLMSNDKICHVCGSSQNIHKHHIFYGTANRQISEKQGCWCYLCAFHHNMSNYGAHFDKNLDIKLKRICQEKWEEKNGDREQFIKVFGKSYL